MGFAIHPISGEKRKTHDHYPQTKQIGQQADCLFCLNANTCKKRMGIFFVGEKYEVCENHRDKFEEGLKITRAIDVEKTKQEAIKSIFSPTARVAGASKDCLHCMRLHPHHCRNRNLGQWPRQGAGHVCDEYHEVSIRPAGVAKHCDYCANTFLCDTWTDRKSVV